MGDTPLIDLNYDGKAANLRDDKSELTTILPADVLLGNLPNLQDIMNTKAVILQSKLDTFQVYGTISLKDERYEQNHS